MNEPDRLDLSPLDPMGDPDHWRAVVGATLARVDAVLAQRPQDPLTLIASWTRPLLIATAVSLALLIPVEVVLEMREARAEQVQRLVALSVPWERGALSPSGSDFVRALADAARP